MFENHIKLMMYFDYQSVLHKFISLKKIRDGDVATQCSLNLISGGKNTNRKVQSQKNFLCEERIIVCFVFVCFETWSHFVAKADFELIAIL